MRPEYYQNSPGLWPTACEISFAMLCDALMLGTRGLRFGVYMIPQRAKRGAAWGGSGAPGPAPQGCQSPLAVPPKSRNPTKEHPKIMIEFGTAFGRHNAPKSIKKRCPKLVKILNTSMQFSIEFLIRFRVELFLFSQRHDPRFHCYLQHCRGVQHFSQTSESTKQRLQKPSKKRPTSMQNRFKHQPKN